MLRSCIVFSASAMMLLAADNPPNVKVVEEIAAKVNGDIITRGELEKKRQEIELEAKRQGLTGARLKEVVDEYAGNALAEQIDQLLIVQKAKDLSINVDNEVTKQIATIQIQQKVAHPELADPDKFQAYVREQLGIPFEDFKQNMKNQLLIQRVMGQEVMRNISVSEPEMQKYYEEHKSEYMRKEAQVFLSQIVISTEGKTPEQIAAAEKKAKDVSARAKRGEKFAELARDNSDDVETSKTGGYIGAMPKGVMEKSIEDVVFKEKKGFVTEPIKTPRSFLILKVEERQEAGQATYEEVKNDLQDKLMQPKMEPKRRAFLSRLREDAFLEIKDGYVDSEAVPGKDTRWKEVSALKPQTTTKEEVAARRRKHILFVIPHGYAKETKSLKGDTTATPATTDKPAEKK